MAARALQPPGGVRVSALGHAYVQAAERLAAADGDPVAAFDALDVGVTARELRGWFMRDAGISFGELAAQAFGSALAVAMVAVEADREEREGSS